MCVDKGQREEECRNYVMLLQVYQNRLYVCGTYAFSPLCSWWTMDSLESSSVEKGVAKAPFNPRANVTSIVTGNGQLFVGTPTDFSGSDPAIIKTDLQNSGGGMLRTDQYNSKWLNDPQFVGSFEAGEFIYFVFRETASEFINCGKSVYSRIARVCKSDPGGTHILRDNWTSFVKARLNCSLPGDYPFYFNEVQGIAYSYQDNTLYATFTTPENSIHGSAVCAFNLTAINSVFSGPFKHQDSSTSTWERKSSNSQIHNECQTARSPHMHHLRESAKYQLMDDAVQATSIQPLHHASSERFSHIALDVISTKLHDKVTMLFVATESGAIKKISVLPRTKSSCVVEVWRPAVGSDQPAMRIRTMQYLKNADSLYIGTEDAVLRLPAHNCQRHVSKPSCLNAMDPYCGWNELLEACTTAPKGDTLTRHWVQNATECPVISAPVDGSWSSWTPWSKCAQNNGQSTADEQNSNTDYCQCRSRTCDNPAPKNGGSTCTGLTVEVSNCTVHGGWTEWSAYSACSQSCGIAVKTRKRTCTNPKPAHGGRVCVGPDRSDIYCTLSPCPAPEQPQIDGSWGPWGAWSECNVPCGGGFRIRRRKCNDPEPMGGMDCVGCNIDYELCNKQACTEVRKLSPWTPWMMESNTTKGDEYTEHRFRYMCKASVMDASSLKISLSKEEKRTCHPNGSCQR